MRELILSAYYHIEQPGKYATNYWRHFNICENWCAGRYAIISVSINASNIVLETFPMMLWNILYLLVIKIVDNKNLQMFIG